MVLVFNENLILSFFFFIAVNPEGPNNAKPDEAVTV
jgi:hypothetical protein